MVELIITEKPSSAKKVAEALAEGKLIQKRNKQSSYYELTHGKKQILVTSAVGHLFGLVEKNPSGWTYPVFDVEWQASNKSSKELSYVKDYIDTIAQLAKQADEFTIACDYDVEGEVIGFNVVRFVCKKKDANRMKFSTLTKGDLVKSYNEKMNHLDWGQANAGETRHILDWFYGINLSRALTASIKTTGRFKVMSAGRVQGPALKLLVDREREIAAFKPEPYSEIILHGEFEKLAFEADHNLGKIFDPAVVQKIFSVVKGAKQAVVKDVKRTQREQMPPYHFDLTTLQAEGYAQFKITPKETLEIAQSLYLAGVTSYPRTSSQQLDPKLGFVKILTDLSRQMAYRDLCDELLKLKELKPNNGKKTDPAHPAIYPTGLTPNELNPKQQKIYDLIVKRFMATFAKPAVRETMEVGLDVHSELFIAKGTRTVDEQWHRFYKPYVKVDEVTLPGMKEKDIITVKDIVQENKETTPPNRYNQASIIKELEKRNLGTKATRADILDRLFDRGYIEGVQITVTQFGMRTIEVLEKYAATIVDQQLTADFEQEMDKIREGKEKQEKVLERAKKILIELLGDFKKKEKEIGKDLLGSLTEMREKQSYIGQCPGCSDGKLVMKKGKFGMFIACDKYPDCKTTFKLPGGGLVKNSDKICTHCQHPMIIIIRKGKRPQEVCIYSGCSSKVTAEEKTQYENIEQQKVAEPCPKCGKNLVVRKSVYGQFLGCSGYPNCRYIGKIGGEKKAESMSEKTSDFQKRTGGVSVADEKKDSSIVGAVTTSKQHKSKQKAKKVASSRMEK